MIKELWLNLPSKNVKKSTEFFLQMGFKLNERYGNTEHSASFLVGDKNIVVMLFAEHIFKSFTGNDITDTRLSTEILLSIDAQSKEEVDAYAKKAASAGGSVYHEPAESQGWMYGCGFCDLDGHRWNVLYMDMSKMPK